MASKRKIAIFDTTLRDGEQSPGYTMGLKEKLRMAQKLSDLKVDIIEAGFPIASPGELEAVKAIAEQVRGPSVAALARCTKADIDAAWKAVGGAEKPRIHVFISTSPIHMKHKLNMTPAQVLGAVGEWVKYAHGMCGDVEFSAEDATRTELPFLHDVVARAVDAGAKTINLPDSVGYTVPSEYSKLIAGVRGKVPGGVVISTHCHDDLGMATANSLAAVEAGAGQIECTINGIGERAGNAALEEVVTALYTRGGHFNAETGINMKEIYSASRMLVECTGVPIQRNKAIVGDNAFAHEAGIHQHGMLANSETYEIVTPETIGRERSMVIGKHSGRHAISAALAQMGLRPTKEELAEISRRVKAAADEKKQVTPKELEAIARGVTKPNVTKGQLVEVK